MCLINKKTTSATDADDACLCIDEQNPLWLEEANHIKHTAHAWSKSDLESNNSIESEESETNCSVKDNERLCKPQ